MKVVGIYKITNLITGDCYIGQSKDIYRRWKRHKNPNTWERDKTNKLYCAFESYGVESFSFEIIEQCTEELLKQREKYWIKAYNSQEQYNKITCGGDGTFCSQDVVEIRKRYANKERKKEVWKDYKSKINWSGFCKVWIGNTWKDIMPEVYSKENKKFHFHNTHQKGSSNGMAKLTEEDVVKIRKRFVKNEKWQDVYEDYKNKLTKESFFNVWRGYNWKHIVPDIYKKD